MTSLSGRTADDLRAALSVINTDREELGLPPIMSDRYATVFGVKKYIPDVPGEIKNPEFEEKIVRDEEGKFEEKPRAYLPESEPEPGVELVEELPEEPAQAPVEAPEAAPAPAPEPPEADAMATPIVPVGPAFEIPKRPASSPKEPPAERIDWDAFRAEIEASGMLGSDKNQFSEQQVEAWQRRGAMFKVQQPDPAPGEPVPSPVYVFIAHSDGLIEAQSRPQRDKVRGLAKKFAGIDPSQKAARLDAFKTYQTALKELEEREEYLSAVYGSGGVETIGDTEQDIAQEAGALLAKDLAEWPPGTKQLNGEPRSFVIEFDEARMVTWSSKAESAKAKQEQGISHDELLEGIGAVDVTSVKQGLAVTDQSIFMMSRNSFRRPIDSYVQTFLAPTTAETLGQHTIAHEASHVQDDRQGRWDSAAVGPDGEQLFKGFAEQSMEEVDFLYGHMDKKKDNPPNMREWFAEMNKFSHKSNLSNLTPKQFAVAMAFRRMFMLDLPAGESRPPAPTKEWIQENQVLLAKALEAIKD